MKKKWSSHLRIWHWSNALIVLVLVLTGLFIKQGGHVEEYFKKPHILVGFVLCALVPFRMVRARFFGDRRTLDDAQKLRQEAIKIIRANGRPRTHDDFRLFHKAGVKNSYLVVYALLAGMALTGLGMVVMFQMGAPEQTRHLVKEIHEAVFVLVSLFVPLHIGGVVFAEITDEPNITSDMIHGGKE